LRAAPPAAGQPVRPGLPGVLAGQATEKYGQATGNKQQQARGRTNQARGNSKQSVQKIKDMFK